ncbi:2Fe-2S iron-sulfur cluster binding domain-containing protein, partial [Mesorhizobium sp. M7D.F.Ca.US.004.03.1.1]|uniref:flavin reductase family protein n=1 Tax=Mesorhizobium sp. M7D.F.Ca.US.004.03.1.1 TaxID=2496702 RepID=UPI000FCC6361
MLDLKAIVAQQSSDTHFYCCGPTGMLKAFEAAAATLDPDLVHSEFFAAAAPPARGGFEVVLAKSKKTVFIPAGMSILETLNEMGMHIAHSCKEGLCGTCET